MKRVTKKAVREALDAFVGWNYSYNFKECAAVVLFNNAKIEDMTAALDARGIAVVECKPCVSPRTGHMILGVKEDNSARLP